MKKIDCLKGVVRRLFSMVTFLDRNDQGRKKTVLAVRSNQSQERYERRVSLKPYEVSFQKAPLLDRIKVLREELDWEDDAEPERIFGSHLHQDSQDSWVVGDGSAATLEIQGEALVVVQRDYDKSYEKGRWQGPAQTVICCLDDIVRMEFKTSSGWHGECYSERKYDENGRYKEEDWLVILHRSTGSVTVERAFPFTDD